MSGSNNVSDYVGRVPDMFRELADMARAAGNERLRRVWAANLELRRTMR